MLTNELLSLYLFLLIIKNKTKRVQYSERRGFVPYHSLLLSSHSEDHSACLLHLQSSSEFSLYNYLSSPYPGKKVTSNEHYESSYCGKKNSPSKLIHTDMSIYYLLVCLYMGWIKCIKLLSSL